MSYSPFHSIPASCIPYPSSSLLAPRKSIAHPMVSIIPTRRKYIVPESWWKSSKEVELRLVVDCSCWNRIDQAGRLTIIPIFAQRRGFVSSVVPSSIRFIRRSVSVQARSTERKDNPHADRPIPQPGNVCSCILQYPSWSRQCHERWSSIFSQKS